MSFPSSDQIRSDVRALLSRLGRGQPFADDLDVFTASIVRSMNLLELIVALEDRYAIEVSQRDVFEGNLRSVDKLVSFIAARLPAAPDRSCR